jgi:sterol desaturase/sphingolipid hydroxylase (fatty acid hydroxylase superfamily)
MDETKSVWIAVAIFLSLLLGFVTFIFVPNLSGNYFSNQAEKPIQERVTDWILAHKWQVSIGSCFVIFLVLSKWFGTFAGAWGSMLGLAGFTFALWIPLWIPVVLGMILIALTIKIITK